MADYTPTIGALRWTVQIATRVHAPAGSATIAESYTDLQTVRADIQPLGPMTFLTGQQTDRPITHRVIIRWLDWVDQTNVIVRNTQRRDGTVRKEIYRIRKVAEIAGRQRFLELLVEEESRA